MNDESILELYFARDERAIRETDRAYGGRLRALSGRITENAQDAEECVNDTYLKAWDTIPPTRPKHLFAYLAVICRRVSLGVLDRTGAAKRSAVIVELTAELEQCVPGRQQENAAPEELPRLLETFLRAQSPENRRLFLRRYWYGESVTALAGAFGISENAVKLLLRTRDKLRDFLEREGFET